MKTQIITLVVVAIAAAFCQQPAMADEFHDHWVNHDLNHDNRWDHDEFHNANVYYGEHHPKWGEHYTRVDSDNAFGRLDVNHDGYLTREEVRSYHHY